MNFVSEKGNGGASIVPSARKSIHNHGTHCPFWKCEDMGRYGLCPNNRQQPNGASTSQEGTDEVDNVMSKFAHPSSPILTRRNDNLRRNSLNSLNQNYKDFSDDDSDLLSKSSPAILSPISYCSDDESEVNSILNSMNNSRLSANSSSQQSQLNESNSISSSSPHLTRRHREQAKKLETKTRSNLLLYCVSILVLIVGIGVGLYYNVFISDKQTNNLIYDKLSFYNDIRGVGKKYNIQDNSILQVKAGIAAIFERQDTGSFIFVYNSDRSNFNPVYFNNFVNELASAAARYLRNHTKSVHHVIVDTNNIQVKTDKELMNKYLADVDKTGVMLVKELDKVPSNLAMAFHYYCDEYNPLVKKSAIFFTLNMARCSNVSNERYNHEKIEKCLAEKWEKMPQDNIRPLLTRVVNVVIDVTSEF